MSRFAKTGFRRSLPLVTLTAVLLLAVALVLLLPQIQKWFPAEEAQTPSYKLTYQTIARRDAAELASINVSHLDGEHYTLVYDGHTLSLVSQDGSEPVRDTVAENFIKYATTIYVDDTVTEDEAEAAEYLAEMGLDPPRIQVTASFTDGSTIEISLGNAVDDTDYRYYRWSGDTNIYLCSAGVYDTFSYTADMLRSITQPPILHRWWSA